MRKLRLLLKRPKSLAGELSQNAEIRYSDAKEMYKDYWKTDWREPAYECCEQRINYEARKVSRENFRREQPPTYDCEHCKKPFVFEYLRRRHWQLFAGSCEPVVPKHLEWVKADKFSKAAMQRIVDIFYSHLAGDRLSGKRGAAAAMMATSGGAGSEGAALEGVGAEERHKATTGWGRVKMAVGDEAVEGNENHSSAASSAFAGGVSSIKSKLLMAKLKAAEIVKEQEEQEQAAEEEKEEEEAVVAEWVSAKDHPVYKKFFAMVKVIGEASVRKRMVALAYDPSVIDDPSCMIGLEHSIYKDMRVPQNVLGGDSEEEEEEQGEEEEVYGEEEEEAEKEKKKWFETDSAERNQEGEEDDEKEQRAQKMKGRMEEMLTEDAKERDIKKGGLADAYVNTKEGKDQGMNFGNDY